MRLRLGLAALALASAAAYAEDPPVTGLTAADAPKSKHLAQSIVALTHRHGKCPTVEGIQVSDIPRDFTPPQGSKDGYYELWTAIGCGKTFPFWVGLYGGGGIVEGIGLYKWHSTPPN
jgi:hypothetical protein